MKEVCVFITHRSSANLCDAPEGTEKKYRDRNKGEAGNYADNERDLTQIYSLIFILICSDATHDAHHDPGKEKETHDSEVYDFVPALCGFFWQLFVECIFDESPGRNMKLPRNQKAGRKE
jgi:hypothetical protein